GAPGCLRGPAELHRAARTCRHRTFADGRYEFVDYLDDDGIDPQPIRFQVAVSVLGSELEVDFSGTSAQVKGAINCVLSFTRSSVYACVRCLLPATLPNNEGYMRTIKVIAPAGTIVNPLPPAPV